MSTLRCALVLCLTALSLSAVGCMGIGGSPRDGAAKKSLPDSRGPRTAARDDRDAEKEEFAGLSPEASMHRDLLQLREREARQVETVENMRVALDQGRDGMRREEEKLREIRLQIDRYDEAMRRYEMASRYAVPRDDYRRPQPRDSSRDQSPEYPPRDSPNDSRSVAGDNAEYAASRHMRDPERDYGPGIPERGGERRPALSGREEILYDGRSVAQARAPMRPNSGLIMGDLSHGDAVAVPAEPAQQLRQVRPAPVNPVHYEESGDGDGLLFAEAAAQRNAAWPAATPVPAPASSPAKTVQRQQSRAPAADDDGLNDEIFVPDLFLSRR